MYKRFQQLFLDKNIKQSELARDTGLPAPLFSEWKKGKSNPKVDKLQKIADYFGVPISFLLATGPFEHWQEIDDNREMFFDSLGWGGDKVYSFFRYTHPDQIPLVQFINFIDNEIESVQLRDDESGFDIEWKDKDEFIRASNSWTEAKQDGIILDTKSKLRSVARLQENENITPEQDKQIADFIDFLLSQKEE